MRKTPVKVGAGFGTLTVVQPLPHTRNEHGHMKWRCLCDCGREIDVWGYNLAKKKEGQVACLNRECRKIALSRMSRKA